MSEFYSRFWRENIYELLLHVAAKTEFSINVLEIITAYVCLCNYYYFFFLFYASNIIYNLYV